MQLSTEQLDAATSLESRIFVEAAPGSGKTAVAAERFGVIRFGPTHNRPVLCLSFTRSATNELRERIRRRWGGAAVSWPHGVTTFDAFHRSILEFLLRAKLLQWPGGHTTLQVHDTWRGQSDARRILAGAWLRVPLVKNGIVVTEAVPAPEETYGYSRKSLLEDALGEGYCTHAEVRKVLRSALNDADIRASVLEYVKRRCGAVIVDEFFDADETDLALVGAACRGGLSVTVIGDPWQAIYEFRGARPDLALQFLERYSFVRLPLSKSYRFKTDGIRAYATALRVSAGSTLLPISAEESDIVLANSWSPLWKTPNHVLPLSFGPVGNLSDALLTILLDNLTLSRFGLHAVYWSEATDLLGISEGALITSYQEGSFLSIMSALIDDLSYTLDDVFGLLCVVVKDLGSSRKLRRLSAGENQVRDRLESLRCRVRAPGRTVLGITVHQAKGREWQSVGVRLTSVQVKSLRDGLRVDSKEDRLAYVALTRARLVVGTV
jgi:DNA helicase-2/ATP-dependent DNA helicase PcrA